MGEVHLNPTATALSEWHRKRGATIGVWFGCQLPDSFGNWETEYRALHDSVGLLDKSYRAHLEFSGPDRVRYLNAILTNNIKELAPNHGTVSLFLSPQGHIQAEMETYALGEALFCISYAMIRERLISAMDKYIIMDDVMLTDRTEEFVTFAVEGPKAAALVRGLTGVELQTMDELEVRDTKVGTVEGRIIKRSPGGVPAAEFLVKRDKGEEFWTRLEDAVRREGGTPVGYRALNAVRLELGIPWFGYDFGERQIPHEAGLQDTHISYTKGCYTGQEIVERVRSRGQVNRVRVSLKFEGVNEAPEANTPLLAEGKEIGYVTRTGFSPAVNAWIGMAYVRRERSATGTAVDIPSGRATVVSPPIV
jgi:folate-binding protein YgfZ